MGKPNYAEARIPITSGLNISAWEKALDGYPDQMLIQYLKFGFPLSIINPNALCNTNIQNHHSAMQFPAEVQEYLHTEGSMGAMLGPVNKVDSPHFHCSPLLTRPKDIHRRRMILNLSHPYGASVNDHVSKDKFDGHCFTLKFPSIDDIVEAILAKDDPVLFKLDVSRAFRNLRSDPVDSLKFGLK